MGKRWKVIVRYHEQYGEKTAIRYIEELSELEALIEHGPDWNAIERIEVSLNGSV